MSDPDNKRALAFFREKNTNFPHKPNVAADLDIFEMPDGLGIQFRGLSNPVVMKGALAETLLPKLLQLLDGTRDLDTISKQLPANTEAEDIAALLMNLYMRGVIIDAEGDHDKAPNAVSDVQKLFWSRRLGVTRLNHSSSEVANKIKTAKILLVAEGLLGAKVYDLLLSCGFEKVQLITVGDDRVFDSLYTEVGASPLKVSSGLDAFSTAILKEIDKQQFVVAAVRNGSIELLERINELCMNHSVEWLRVQDNGSWIDCGPYVNPFHTPCFECLVVRQISVKDYAIEEELYQQALSGERQMPGMKGESMSLACTAASYAVQEIERIITGIETPILNGRTVKFSSDGNIESSNFIRVPGCEICARGDTFVAVGSENGIRAH